MKAVTLYDANGEPFAYVDDENTIYLFSGEAIAYLDGSSVYGFSGKHLGRFEGGWVRDHYGRAVLFTEEARDEPFRPNIHHTLPEKALKSMKPRKHPQEKPSLPVKKSSLWSRMTSLQFFQIGS